MPDKFGRYEIKSELGRGGMATVYHAYDPRFERDVAIKVLPHAFLHDPQFRARFEREAKTIALLEHPAIVPVYDFGEEDGQPYIVMRYMSGGSLADRIKKSPVPPEEAYQVISRLAPALDAAHSRGVIHRDLKPGNILFDQYGNAFLSDFGIARITQTQGTTLTQGAILGTPAYMSPEQISGDSELTGRSDIYAMGVILYEMLAGVAPYHSDTPGKIMMMHILEAVPDIRQAVPDVSPELDGVIRKAMAKNPGERFGSLAEMADALQEAGRGLSQSTLVGATRISSPQVVIQGPQRTPTGPLPSQNLVDSVISDADAALPPKTPSGGVKPASRGVTFFGWIAGLLVVLLMGGTAAASLFYYYVLKPNQVTSPTPTQEVVPIALAATAPAQASITPTAAPPSLTPSPLPTSPTPQLPTRTSTSTKPPDTATPTITLTPVPTAVVIGGADKLALLGSNDIWTMNIDGSDLIRLTNDHAEKKALQWTPDGSAIVYITGRCIKKVDAGTGRVDVIVCYENAEYLDAFEISPDGTKVAVSVLHQLYIIRYDLQAISKTRTYNDLIPMGVCPDATPLKDIAYKEAHWSNDGQKLAVVFIGAEAGRHIDLIRLIDLSTCTPNPQRLHEFPAGFFSMSGYNEVPTISSIGYNGISLFALNSFQRNGGFGNLYVYNTEVNKLQTVNSNYDFINPIGGKCCYRDPRWSPDGRFLAFAFQDITQGTNKIEIYYVTFGDIGTGAKFMPFTLPDGFFQNRDEKPYISLRKAVQ